MTGRLDLRTDEATLARLVGSATVVTTEPTVLRVEGTGAADCLQGLLTCDVVAPGTGSAGYGALLTPKGMIEVDLVVLRDTTGFTLIGPGTARDRAVQLLGRNLPPRLARLTDATGTQPVLWLVGAEVESLIHRAGLPWPATAASIEPVATLVGGLLVSRPPSPAPWRALLTGQAAAVRNAAEQLARAGGVAGTREELHLCRVLAGWPGLGHEIDDRTLPQEVRYDAIGGVSYTKGCYVGQETVARVHFRGHVNRELRGLVWTGGTAPPAGDLTRDGRSVGRLTSVVQLETRGFGLGLIRREILPASMVDAGGMRVTVADLPFPEWPAP